MEPLKCYNRPSVRAEFKEQLQCLASVDVFRTQGVPVLHIRGCLKDIYTTFLPILLS